jgi:GTP:adenosylcobinamide-phosphate guanylyltransferase
VFDNQRHTSLLLLRKYLLQLAGITEMPVPLSPLLHQKMERVKAENEATQQKEAARVNTCKDLEKQLRKLQLERDHNDKHRLREQEESKEEEQQMQQEKQHHAAITKQTQRYSLSSARPSSTVSRTTSRLLKDINITKEKEKIRMMDEHDNDKQQCSLKQKEAARVNTCKDLEKQLRKLQLERDHNDKHRLREQEESKEAEQQMRKEKQHHAAITKQTQRYSLSSARPSSIVSRTTSRLLKDINITKEKEKIRMMDEHDNDKQQCRRTVKASEALKSDIQECERTCMNRVRVLRRQHPTQQEEIAIAGPGTDITSAKQEGDAEAAAGNFSTSMLEVECGEGAAVVQKQKDPVGEGQDYWHAVPLLVVKDTRPGTDQRSTSQPGTATASYIGSCDLLEKRPPVEATTNESSTRITSRRKAACMKLAALKNKTIDSHPHSSATSSPTQSLRRGKKSFGMPRRENANIKVSNKEEEHQEIFYGMGESIVIKPISPSPGLTKSKKDGSMKSPLHRRKARYANTQLLDRQVAGILPLPCSSTRTSARTSTTTTPRSLLLQKQQSDSALLLGRGSTTTGVRRTLLFGNNKSSRNGARENREYLSLNEPGEDQQEQNEDEDADADADADEATQKDNTTNCYIIKSGGLRAKKYQARSGQHNQDQEPK